MTLEETALLIAIMTDPEDDTSRLVYADWLDENGEADRAAFIRLQVLLSRMPEPDELTIGGRFTSDRERSKHTCSACRGIDGPDFCPFHILRHREQDLLFTIGSLHCTFAEWVEHADPLHWHPAQTMPCDEPRDPKQGVYDDGFGLRYDPARAHKRCPKCRGIGHIRRPLTPTAQPIRHVTLTTPPEGQWEGQSGSDELIFSLDGYPRTVTESEVLASRKAQGTWNGRPHTMKDVLTTFWPRLTFTLPRETIFHA